MNPDSRNTMGWLAAVLEAARAEAVNEVREVSPVPETRCAHCGAVYRRPRPDSRYCSNAHRQAAYRARRGQE